MGLSIGKMLFLLIYLFFLLCACRTPHTEVSGIPLISKTFTQGYDEVWDALEEVMVEELLLPITLKDKKKGIIETDWISVIRMRGTLRWHLKIIMDRVENQTVVRIYERVEEPMSKKDIVGKMKTKQGEVKTGWQTSQEKVPETDTILNRLSLKLGK